MSSLKEWEELLQKYEELKLLCENYDNSAEQFSQILSAYLDIDILHRIQIAYILEVSEVIVSIWANGHAIPLSRMKKEIVDYISQKAKGV